MQRSDERKDENGNTNLHLAIINNDKQLVEQILQSSVNQSIKNNYGETCIHLAARMGHVDVMSVLLDYWFDLEAKDYQGNTCLHIAVKENKVEIVKLLLEYWVNIDIKNSSGKMSLDFIDLNDKNYASKEILNLLLHARVTQDLPIHEAAKSGNIELVRKLLKNEPTSINIRNSLGETPFLLAVKQKHIDIAQYLIEQGANINLASKEKTYYAVTPFCFALKNDHVFALSLLNGGAKSHRVICEHKAFPIHVAIQYQRNDIAKELITRRPELINVKDLNELSTLCFAVKFGNMEMVNFLLENGANKRDAKRYALKKKDEKLALILIEHDELFSIKDAIEMDSLKMLQLLLGREVDIYEGDKLTEYKGKNLTIQALLKQADLYHKYKSTNKEISFQMNSEEKLAVIEYMTTVLMGRTQRIALKNALDPKHIMYQRLFENKLLKSFLGSKLNKEILLKELAKNISEKFKKMESQYPACYAAQKGDLAALIKIISENPRLLDKQGYESGTPLQMAINHGHRDVIYWLLSQGANPTLLYKKTNKKNESQFNDINQLIATASLYWHLSHQNRDYSKKLTAKEKIDILKYIDIIFDDVKKIALYNEICDMHSNLGKFFHPIDQLTNNFFKFPGVFAAEQGDIVKLNALYEKDPNVIKQIDNRGLTPLQAAINTNQQDIVQWLNNHGAAQENTLEDQLAEAVAIGNNARVKELLEKKVDPNKMSTEGALPLVTAIFNRKIAIINFLLMYGADFNMQENRWGISAATLSSTLEQGSFLSKMSATKQSIFCRNSNTIYPMSTPTPNSYYSLDNTNRESIIYLPEQYYSQFHLPKTVSPSNSYYDNNQFNVVYSDKTSQHTNTTEPLIEIKNNGLNHSIIDEQPNQKVLLNPIYNSPTALHTLLFNERPLVGQVAESKPGLHQTSLT